jgi:hypothetical protein
VFQILPYSEIESFFSLTDCNLQNNPCNTGKCIKKVPNGHYCICPQGFTGQNCETGKAKES